VVGRYRQLVFTPESAWAALLLVAFGVLGATHHKRTAQGTPIRDPLRGQGI
jgi:hypothetical protein